MAKTSLIVPNLHNLRSGNAVTASRYQRVLESLGHKVLMGSSPHVDLTIALNAYRSARQIAALHEVVPDQPIVVVLTGTDIYKFIDAEPDVVQTSIRIADRLVGLNDCVADAVPTRWHAKLRIIHQSAATTKRRTATNNDRFNAVVVGHLRAEKDPLLVAEAVRKLPPSSRIMVHHYGAAYDSSWSDAAKNESQSNPRYKWHGAASEERVTDAYLASSAMVLSSRIEGGANVLSEAIMAELPVLATAIPGNLGILGPNYAGYFPVGDAAALRTGLLALEHEPSRRELLAAQLRDLQPKVSLQQEEKLWSALIDELV